MIGFFKLIEQFTTQEEPQYCGLAALSMTLNALGIDPRRTWKGAWRWFCETMLDCCKSMDDIKRDGITLSQAACLARCNGADVSIHRYGNFDGTIFRQLLREVCASEDRHMVVSYSRKTFKQSGDGHFSPIGGYNPQRDMALILDVARFKYSPHWVRVDDLMEAMGLLDPEIGRPRGFLLMSSRQPRESALFALPAQPEMQQPPCPLPEPHWAAAHRFLTRDAPALLARLLSPEAHGAESQTGGEGDAAAGHGEEDHDGDDEEDVGGPEAQQPSASTAIDSSNGKDDGKGGSKGIGSEAAASSSAVAVPSLEDVVGCLVGAAPLDSVCALLARRPTLGFVGEQRGGPCCGCGSAAALRRAGGAESASSAGATATAAAVASGAATAPVVSPFVVLAPCNSSRCGRGNGSSVGAGGDEGGAARAGVGVATYGGGVGAATFRKGASSSSLTSRSDDSSAGSLDSAGTSGSSSFTGSLGSGFSSCSGAGSCGSGGSISSSGSPCADEGADGDGRCSSGGGPGGGMSCCHGEPLEHHCVPPQVQSLVAAELRFTNCFKLVDYWLRRHRGCTHVAPPDLTAFMQPAGQAAGAPATAAAAASKAAAVGATADTACASTSSAGAAASPAAPANGGSAPRQCQPAAAASQQGLVDGPASGLSGGSGSLGCGCELGLPELAAEKLTVALLILGEGAGWPQEQQQQQQQQLKSGGEGAAAGTAAGGAAAVAPRQCGRPRCRRCRQRAAEAGDRAAAVELLGERWRQLMRMVPLGLFASTPVLQDEVSYLRVRLSHGVTSCRT